MKHYQEENVVWKYIPSKLQKLVIPAAIDQDYMTVISGQQEHVSD